MKPNYSNIVVFLRRALSCLAWSRKLRDGTRLKARSPIETGPGVEGPWPRVGACASGKGHSCEHFTGPRRRPGSERVGEFRRGVSCCSLGHRMGSANGSDFFCLLVPIDARDGKLNERRGRCADLGGVVELLTSGASAAISGALRAPRRFANGYQGCATGFWLDSSEALASQRR